MRSSYYFLITSVMLSLFLPKHSGLTANQIDLGIILFAGFGFFALAHESARLVPLNVLGWMRIRASNQYEYVENLHKYAEFIMKPWDASSPIHPLLDPLRVAETQRQRILAEAWRQNTGAILAREKSAAKPRLGAIRALPWPDSVADPAILADRDNIYKAVDDFEEIRNEVEQLEATAERNAVEEICTFLAPYAGAIAIGLGIYKALHY